MPEWTDRSVERPKQGSGSARKAGDKYFAWFNEGCICNGCTSRKSTFSLVNYGYSRRYYKKSYLPEEGSLGFMSIQKITT